MTEITFFKVRCLLLIAPFVVLLSWSTSASACSCLGEGPPCEAFGSARAVFIGTVIGAKEQRQVPNDDGGTTTFDVGEIYFKVEESFLGLKGARAVIHSGTGGGDCGYWFLRGKRYLVYAYGEPDNLGTNICTRTRLLESAEADLEFLRNLPRKGTGARIYGSVVASLKDPKSEDWRTPKPLDGVTVKIEGQRRTFDAVTDSKGEYEITGLPAGRYKVYAVVPDYFSRNDYWEREVELNDRGCAREYFVAENDSRISGRVLKDDGNGFRNAQVELIPVDSKVIRRLGGDADWADENGFYELSKIAPGRYILGINLSASPDKDMPYAATYYPGVNERSKAKVIEIGLGEKLTDLDIQLSQPIPAHLVRGFVVWPDGSLAKDVDIYLEDVNYRGWCVNGCAQKTDQQGRFEVSGFQGYSYRVVVTADKVAPDGKGKEAVYGMSSPFQLDTPIENIRIVLSLSGRPWDKESREKEP